MRVHRITVRDVKGVRESTVELPERGVVVVEGPNEVGKSTLLEAFDKLLDPRYKSTSSSKEVRGLQPVGRDVGPYVEAELTVGGHRVRYAKRWLRQPLTTLEVLTPAPEQLSGEAAHARMERLLSDSLDRTLFDALRLAQAGDGSVAPLTDSAVLGAALDAAAGSELHVEGGDQVLSMVEEEYLTYFTRTGRPTGDYRRAREAWTEAQGHVAEAHRVLEEAARLLERQQDAREARARAEEELARAREAQREAADAQDAAQTLVEAHERVRASLGVAAERARATGKDHRLRVQQVEQLEQVGQELARTERGRDEDQAALDALAPRLAEAQTALADAEAELERAEAVCDLARSDVDHLVQTAEAESMAQLLAHVRDAVDELVAARRQVPGRPVDGATLRRAEDLAHRADVLRARHEAASAHLRVESLGGSVEVARTGPSGACDVLEAGAAHETALTEQIVVTVPGAVRVVLEPEAGGRARQEELEQVRAALTELLAGAGVVDLDALRTAAEATAAAQGAVRDRTRDLTALLAGRGRAELDQALAGTLPSALVEEVRRVREQLSAPLDPADRPLPADVPTARALVRAAQDDVQRARDGRRRAHAAHVEIQRSATRLRAALDRADGHLGSLRRQVEGLTTALAQARSLMSDDALEQELHRRSAALAEVEAEVARARRAVAQADIEGVAARLRAAAGAVEGAASAQAAASAALSSLSGQVEMAQSEGRRELHDLALAALDDAERRLVSLDRRARAARHLWRTLTEHRDRAHAAYARPYTQALEELGRRVYGPGFGVTVDDQLVLRARTLDGSTVPFEHLSGGAKEQLGILARLAVARLVDPTQGVPVVIDDALGYSDPERLRQMGEVLGASAADAEVQVILLTCTPDRYAAVPDARTVRLTA